MYADESIHRLVAEILADYLIFIFTDSRVQVMDFKLLSCGRDESSKHEKADSFFP